MIPYRKIGVDNFAGGGGASHGYKRAVGRSPDIAINHDPECVALHVANHPETRHYCEDVYHVDPVEACQGHEVGDAWFSPDCTDFSKAKNKKPRSKKRRGLAWVVLKWGVLKRPDRLYLENVEEFQHWSPLLDDGSRDPDNKGRTFRAFLQCLTTGIDPNHPDMPEIRQALGENFPYERLYHGLGYQVEWRELRACDYGAPTIRRRLYLIARCDGVAIAWPSPTHCDPDAPGFAASGLKPWRMAAECIDLSLPCPSIFLTRRQARKLRKIGINIKRPLVRATKKRIAKGVYKFVLEAKEPFFVNFTHQGSDRVEAVTHPFRVITGAHRGEKGLVIPHLTEHANASAQRTFPLNSPLRTQCAEIKGGHFALVAAFLSKFYGTNIGSRMDRPMHSITADGNHLGQVRAFLQKYYGASEGQSFSLRSPIHTIPTLDRFGLVTVDGEDYELSDIGLRMLVARELYRGQGFPDSYIINIIVEKIRRGKKVMVPLTGTAKVRMCGNSVCPDVAEAIIRSNHPFPAGVENNSPIVHDAVEVSLT